jgi:2-amino-4-hydroxy-6-hydroxymethyldihydropteridine diphosphokinase
LKFEIPTAGLALVALGSNLGDSLGIVAKAMDLLERLSQQPLRRSSFWRTTPVNCPLGSPSFVNAVVGLVSKVDETPETLLQKLQALEKDFGRTAKKAMNEPRPLDLDLIAFGRETRATPTLMLPHPRAHRRRFVLEPLAEIAPDLVLPGQSQNVSEQLKALRSLEIVQRIR